MDVDDALRFVGATLFVGSNGYLKVSALKRKERYVHRLIMNADDDHVVDHINGEKLDNRRVNLRLCTRQENNCNSRVKGNNKTGVTGVRWDKARMQWAAQISYKNKMIPLGRFNTFDAAVEARKAAEIRYHGEFSASNGVLNVAR